MMHCSSPASGMMLAESVVQCKHMAVVSSVATAQPRGRLPAAANAEYKNVAACGLFVRNKK